jgi:hypothetical protein
VLSALLVPLPTPRTWFVLFFHLCPSLLVILTPSPPDLFLSPTSRCSFAAVRPGGIEETPTTVDLPVKCSPPLHREVSIMFIDPDPQPADPPHPAVLMHALLRAPPRLYPPWRAPLPPRRAPRSLVSTSFLRRAPPLPREHLIVPRRAPSHSRRALCSLAPHRTPS